MKVFGNEWVKVGNFSCKLTLGYFKNKLILKL